MDSLIRNMYHCPWREHNCFATNYLTLSYIKLSLYTPRKRTDGVELYLHSLFTSSLGLGDSNSPWPFYPLSLRIVFTLTSKLGLPQFFWLKFLFLSLLQKFSEWLAKPNATILWRKVYIHCCVTDYNTQNTYIIFLVPNLIIPSTDH